MRDVLLVIAILGCVVLGMALNLKEKERARTRTEVQRVQEELQAARQALAQQKVEFANAQSIFEERIKQLESSHAATQDELGQILGLAGNVDIRVPMEVINKQVAAGNVATMHQTKAGTVRVTLKSGLHLSSEGQAPAPVPAESGPEDTTPRADLP